LTSIDIKRKFKHHPASSILRRRGLKSAGTMSGNSEAGTFANDVPDYEQGLDFETSTNAENEHDIGQGWDGVMHQHRLSAAAAASLT
jgi:hypothetical protein